MKYRHLLLAPIAAIPLLVWPALSQESPEEHAEHVAKHEELEGRSCILDRDITFIEVQDDQTIDFSLREGVVMQNKLPERCERLFATGHFDYRTTRRHVCDGTEIRFSPAGSMRRRPVRCELGEFTQIEPADPTED